MGEKAFGSNLLLQCFKAENFEKISLKTFWAVTPLKKAFEALLTHLKLEISF